MKSRTVELAVGIFVILFAAALFLLAMRVSGLAGSNLGETYTLTAKFDNISGLKERAKVTISGVKVGQVQKIAFDPMVDRAIVTIAMDKKLTTFTPEQLKQVEKNALEDLKYSYEYEQADAAQQKAMEKQLIDNMKHITTIDEDAYIKVATNGIIGEKYLKVEPGGAFTYIAQGGSFPDTQTQGTVEIEDLVNKFITNSSTSQNTSQAAEQQPASSPATTASQQSSDDAALFKE
ncbi:outer membrane lipid asymmetry maintenance protein MlaD [Acinetobacter puyangensis]|uniref:Phospholipid/cholesterol/gamma-HCH transport system substrate-binding protein n=1 Tax=Acinetobacter puyangensis TaxID=1096779 RepID=A0A240E6Y5_9GAMM|nr:MlaD family protein [Acinetobacter puyangensis]SNX44517.1 phospholipid/cholesterol/gamma-HCH transport system substrate-binding protein [Acinetobacter puyangensis]